MNGLLERFEIFEVLQLIGSRAGVFNAAV